MHKQDNMCKPGMKLQICKYPHQAAELHVNPAILFAVHEHSTCISII